MNFEPMAKQLAKVFNALIKPDYIHVSDYRNIGRDVKLSTGFDIHALPTKWINQKRRIGLVIPNEAKQDDIERAASTLQRAIKTHTGQVVERENIAHYPSP